MLVLVYDRYIQILHMLKLRQFIVSGCVGKVLPFQVCLSTIIPYVDQEDTVLSGVTLISWIESRSLFRRLKKISTTACFWYKIIFTCIIIHQLVMKFKKMKKVRSLPVRLLSYRMAEPAQQCFL